MTNETATENLGPQKGETAEKFKERINETEREMKRAAKAAATATPAPVAVTPSAQVPVPATQGDVPPAGNPAKAVLVTGNAELDEWLEKKGPMTLENLASSYRESEREMYRKMEEARKTQGQPVTPAPPVPPATFPPYVYQTPPPPAYMPPPVQPPQNVEQLAKQYGLSPEDFEKVAPLANDMARSVVEQELRRVLPPMYQQINGVNREMGRQKELVELMSDPAFKNPQVQFEIDRILKEEPNTFAAQAQPVRYAFEKALTRIARSNLGGSTGQSTSTVVPGVVPSTQRPPSTAGGNGNGGGGAPQGTPQEMTPELFARMSMDEKKAHLIAIGVRPV